ncbi:MAG TPA: right-handed parallel beta-helix repeat-containing protein [Nitrososphaeraceae archaeon]|nr:right-handed parallel beta-helix repeat-containing protein [Nitrososphaeraceae archaeon]
MQFIVIVSYSLILAIILWFGIYYISSNAQTMKNELDVNNVNSIPFEKEGNISITQISPCSITIERDFKLENNLNCYNDGLIVSGNGITIDLNGKTITGPEKALDYIGIGVIGTSITIKGPGTITNFHNGVGILDSNNIVINSINLQNNEIGIFSSDSSYIEISNNDVYSNNMGISASSNNNLILRNNSITNNEMSGITLAKTNQSSIETNNIEGSNVGIYIDEASNHNKITSNTLFNAIDINNANGLEVNSNYNQYYQNKCMISEPTGLCINPK